MFGYRLALEPGTDDRGRGAATRIRLFASRHESFYLAVPVVLAGFLIADMLYIGLLSGRWYERQIIAFLTAALFLNNLHVYFTFSFLLKVPEFRAWIEDDTGGRPWRFWLEISSVGALVFVLLLISNQFIDVHWRAFLLIGVVLLILPVHDGVAQMFGLSMLYNRRIAQACGYDEQQRLQAAACARRERWGFRVLLVSYLGTLSAVALSTLLFAENWVPGWFGKLLWGTALLSALFVIANSLLYPGALTSNKPLFLSRLLLFPMVPLVPFAYAVMSACHGTEYLAVAAKVRERSAMNATARAQFTYTLLALCVFGLALLLCRPDEGLIGLLYDARSDDIPLWVRLAAFVSVTLAFVHYYVDRRVFRFRESHCRQHILPLLG